MFNEFDLIALTVPIPFEQAGHIPELSPLRESGEGLLPGDVGTIVDASGDGKYFIVEFLVPDTYGYPVALTDVSPHQIRLATQQDLDNDRFRGKATGIILAIPILQELEEEWAMVQDTPGSV